MPEIPIGPKRSQQNRANTNEGNKALQLCSHDCVIEEPTVKRGKTIAGAYQNLRGVILAR
jgi:hypothetical protein